MILKLVGEYMPRSLGLFFCGSVLGQDTLEPQPSTGETQERNE